MGSPPDDDADCQTLPLPTPLLGVLHKRGVKTVGDVRRLRHADGTFLRVQGIGRVFQAQLNAALDGTGDPMDYTPAQLRALATISETTGKPAKHWRPVHTPPDMTWVDYVDEAGEVGQCCRDGDGWRQAPTGTAPVFLLYTAPATPRTPWEAPRG